MMRRHLYVLLLLLVSAGCGSGSFLGHRYDNFKAYYNTFYNAKKSFDRGIKSLARSDDPINRQLYLPIFTTPDQASRSKDFANAIKKSADLLRDHPESKWVDDALLLIGKSYFYQKNYVGAEQKFQEVIDRGSKLQDESHFWMARTLIASHAYNEASNQIHESLNREGISKRWASMLHLAMGELFVKQQAWPEAAEELEIGLKDVPDPDWGARARFLLGQVYETIGQYDKAVEVFDGVEKFNPLYELSYAAKISAVRIEGRHGDADDALKRLRNMERDDNNFGYRTELAYMRGRIYLDMGRGDDARDTFERLLYDREPTTNISTVRGRVQYALGELYRDVYRDYVMAAAYFDTAATAVRPGTSGQSGRLAVKSDLADQGVFSMEAITDGEERKEQFRAYASAHEQVARLDSLLELGMLDQASFDERILGIRRQRAVAIAEQRLARETRAIEQSFQKRNNNNDLNNQSSGLPAGKIVPGVNAPESGGNAGFLNVNDPMAKQEGRMNFVDRWGDRPLVTNWRRLDAITGSRGSSTAEEGLVSEVLQEEGGTDELPAIDISGIPRDSLSQAVMRAKRANARYELANVLFLAINRPDSAAVWYRKVIEEDGDQPVAQRAYYALAEVQKALGDNEGATRLYDQILQNYATSDFAGRVRKHLGREASVYVADSTTLAEDAYSGAYARWQEGDYVDALNVMIELAGAYPTTQLPPRALFAAGAVYTEWARRDGLDLFAPLPISVPDSILQISGLQLAQPNSPAATETDSTNSHNEGSGRNTVEPRDSLGTEGNKSVPIPPSIDLPRIYETIVERYADTPYATQARKMLSALDEYKPAQLQEDGAPTDSLVLMPDSLSVPATDSLVLVPDTTGVSMPEDEAEPKPPIPRRLRLHDADDERLLRPPNRNANERPRPDSTEVANPDGVDQGDINRQPLLIGGLDSLQQIFRYPPPAMNAGLVGTVSVQMRVDAQGRTSDQLVTRGVSPECDEEALRVARLARFKSAPNVDRVEPVVTSLTLRCGPE